MTHTHEWRLFTGTKDKADPAAYCVADDCRKLLSFPDVEAAVNACAGVTLGEGASVKRLVEALALFLAVHAEGGFIEPDDDVLAGGRAALAPFVESE